MPEREKSWIRLGAAPPDAAPRTFRRGRAYPKAIAWFGFRSFWGHLWSLAASIIASEDIDSRDWMSPDEPGELVRRIALELRAPGHGGTLTEALGRDLWIDFVADTGDDADVGRAVGELLFAWYEVEGESGEIVRLPRGDILMFGGDTAYPVASDLEIHNRVIVPFNQALRAQRDEESPPTSIRSSTPRVLIGVPGNHDWYAGLDGFGRMFRAPLGDVDRASVMLGREDERAPSDVSTTTVAHFFEWAEAFRVGKEVVKRSALPLIGYRPVQSASYWALRVAPDLDLWGPDRQLYDLDPRQRHYFARARDDTGPKGIALCLADPPYAFLEPFATGQRVLKSLNLDLEEDAVLAVTGDIHHYCRLSFGKGLHVTAGGGGAFLHPARISRKGAREPDAEFPGPKASVQIALRAPLEIAMGRAGWMLHTALALAYLPMHLAARHAHPTVLGAVVTGAAIGAVLAFIYGFRHVRWASITAYSFGAGALLGAVPFGMGNLAALVNRALELRASSAGAWAIDGAGLVAAAFIGTALIGVYFMALTIFGVAADQGFGVLAHPGYKHFVRMRVRADGSGIEGFVIGKVDPLSADSPAVLVDRWDWKNPVKRA
ncbi:MAG: hypothetical protein U0414_20520 [Polyangiaceae bacterium]